MILKYALSCLIMFVVSTSGTALANDIYKWTDENGNVHYEDRPSGEATEERVAIRSRATDPSKVRARVESSYQSRKEAEEAAAAEPAGPTEEELRAKAKERAEKCDTYKARLQKFVTSRRLYKEDENGERVYLNEEETQAARERVENQVQEYCNP